MDQGLFVLAGWGRRNHQADSISSRLTTISLRMAWISRSGSSKSLNIIYYHSSPITTYYLELRILANHGENSLWCQAHRAGELIHCVRWDLFLDWRHRRDTSHGQTLRAPENLHEQIWHATGVCTKGPMVHIYVHNFLHMSCIPYSKLCIKRAFMA